MIGVDANVLTRLLVNDDASQHETARRFFSERSRGSPAFISAVALVETCWTLQRRYGYGRDLINEQLRAMLSSDDFHFEHGERLADLLDRGERTNLDVADHLVSWSGLAAGCSHTVTFDRGAAKRVEGMELVA
ncbi:MAG: VapC toxin family PIN domain ribonuclease [Mesorhizobium amorphae]|nr:MAG: VapC toxin family PIN domain ribonuclease [Mesorhizobium amorphae]